MGLLNFQKLYRKLAAKSGLKTQIFWEGMGRRIKCKIILIKKQTTISYVVLSRWVTVTILEMPAI